MTVSPQCRERAVDLTVQAVGVGVGIGACAGLLAWAVAFGDGPSALAAAAYGFCLVAMFGFSFAYAAAHPRSKAWLRVCDHCAIYLLIAGTYTPLCIAAREEGSALVLLGVVWLIALVGIVLEITLRERFQRASIVLYLLLGWTALVDLDAVTATLPRTGMVLLVAGGIVYTLGVPAHCCRRLPFNAAIWHGAVVTAATCHLGAVALSLAAIA